MCLTCLLMMMFFPNHLSCRSLPERFSNNHKGSVCAIAATGGGRKKATETRILCVCRAQNRPESWRNAAADKEAGVHCLCANFSGSVNRYQICNVPPTPRRWFQSVALPPPMLVLMPTELPPTVTQRDSHKE